MAYEKENIFAQIIAKKIPSKNVYEDDDIYAFHDIAAAAPVHVLVVPKGEYSSFDDFVANANLDVVGNFFIKVQKIAELLGLRENGYRIITNHGIHAAQSVQHFHVHILGGRALGPLLHG